MTDDEIPELTPEQRIKLRTARAAALGMFTDPDPESREAAWRQFHQVGDVYAEIRDSLQVPDDAGVYAGQIASILRRIPPNWGRRLGCDAGWYPLICELDSVLAQIDSSYEVRQVKEKFGRLSFYAHPKTESHNGFDGPFRQAIQSAQDRSVTICELCSAPGCLHETSPMGPPGRWVKTLCPACCAAGHRGRSYSPVEGGCA